MPDLPTALSNIQSKLDESHASGVKVERGDLEVVVKVASVRSREQVNAIAARLVWAEKWPIERAAEYAHRMLDDAGYE